MLMYNFTRKARDKSCFHIYLFIFWGGGSLINFIEECCKLNILIHALQKKKKYTQTVEDGLIKKRGSGQSRRKNFHLVKGNLLN